MNINFITIAQGDCICYHNAGQIMIDNPLQWFDFWNHCSGDTHLIYDDFYQSDSLLFIHQVDFVDCCDGILTINGPQVKNLDYSISDVTDGTAKNITELYLQMTDVNTGGYIDINDNGEIKKSFLFNKKDEYGFFAKLKALVKNMYTREIEGATRGLVNDVVPLDIDLSQPHFE